MSLSIIDLRRQIDNLNQAAREGDGNAYLDAWGHINHARERVFAQRNFGVHQWIYEALLAIKIPDWRRDELTPQELRKIIDFYAQITPTLDKNDPKLMIILGATPTLDERLLGNIDIACTTRCSEASYLFVNIAGVLSPQEKTTSLLQLLSRLDEECQDIHQRTEAMRPLMEWLVTIGSEDIVDHKRVENELIAIYQNNLAPLTLKLNEENFSCLIRLGMKSLPRFIMVAQDAKLLRPASILNWLDNPTPAELMACLLQNSKEDWPIPALFGQLFNHPNRAQVKKQIERLENMTVMRRGESQFTRMANQCAQWAKNVTPNAQERTAMNWWSAEMLNQLDIMGVGSEYAFNLLKDALSNGGMSNQQILVFNEAKTRAKKLLELDMGL